MGKLKDIMLRNLPRRLGPRLIGDQSDNFSVVRCSIHDKRLWAFLILAVSIGISCGKGYDVMPNDFERKYTRWREYIDTAEDLAFTSKVEPLVANKPYREMVKLGVPAVPYMIQKMEERLSSKRKERQYLLWYAVREISNVNLKGDTELDVGEQTMAKRYIDWWHKEGRVWWERQSQKRENGT